MGKWRILGAVVACLAAVVAFREGFFAASRIYGSFSPNLASTVLIPLSALAALGLGIVTWKYKGKFFSYATLVATAGIGGAVLGLMLMAMLMAVLD